MILLQTFFLVVALLSFFFFLFIMNNWIPIRLKNPFPCLIFTLCILQISFFFILPTNSNQLWEPPLEVYNFPLKSVNVLSFSGSSLYAVFLQDTTRLIQEYQEIDDRLNPIKLHSYADASLHRCTGLVNDGSSLIISDYTIGTEPKIYNIYAFDTILGLNFSIPFYENVPIFPQSLALDDKRLYITGNTPHVLIYPRPETYSSSPPNPIVFKEFGPGPTNRFTIPRGILFHDHLLYVCDNNRVLVFRDLVLVRIYEPIYKPLNLAIWKNNLVIAAYSRTYFYHLISSEYIGEISFPSFHLAASPQFLYIADSERIRVYE